MIPRDASSIFYSSLSAGVGSSDARVISVGRDSLVKVFNGADGTRECSSPIGKLPLSCLALLHPDHSLEVAQQAAAQRLKLFPGSEENDPPLPTILAGSYDNSVYAYSADYGRVLAGAGK